MVLRRGLVLSFPCQILLIQGQLLLFQGFFMFLSSDTRCLLFARFLPGLLDWTPGLLALGMALGKTGLVFFFLVRKILIQEVNCVVLCLLLRVVWVRRWFAPTMMMPWTLASFLFL